MTSQQSAGKAGTHRTGPVHTRIRPFNTADTYPEQHLSNDLAQAVVANDTVYLRGQIGQDLLTRENVGVGDVAAQAEQAMANIAMLLDECGSRLAEIVKITVYLTDIRHREAVYRVMGRWLAGVHYVSTGLVVTALARPEWLVEIDATAVIPAARAAEAAAHRASRTATADGTEAGR
ncbi:RidA family protein [Streptomyces albus]|uniref:RidA family protein n=1 Tax=Streptomyces albus TaxID=1888 RepID=UPI0034111DCB